MLTNKQIDGIERWGQCRHPNAIYLHMVKNIIEIAVYELIPITLSAATCEHCRMIVHLEGNAILGKLPVLAGVVVSHLDILFQ